MASTSTPIFLYLFHYFTHFSSLFFPTSLNIFFNFRTHTKHQTPNVKFTTEGVLSAFWYGKIITLLASNDSPRVIKPSRSLLSLLVKGLSSCFRVAKTLALLVTSLCIYACLGCVHLEGEWNEGVDKRKYQ